MAIGTVVAGVGVAAVLGAGIWWVLQTSPSRPQLSVGLLPGKDSFGALRIEL
jgi:hypothetical protein